MNRSLESPYIPRKLPELTLKQGMSTSTPIIPTNVKHFKIKIIQKKTAYGTTILKGSTNEDEWDKDFQFLN